VKYDIANHFVELPHEFLGARCSFCHILFRITCSEFAFSSFPMLAVASYWTPFGFPNAIGAVLEPMVVIGGHRLLILSSVLR
jgi:hypothetical protein